MLFLLLFFFETITYCEVLFQLKVSFLISFFSFSYIAETDLTGTIPNEIRLLTGLTNIDLGKS